MQFQQDSLPRSEVEAVRGLINTNETRRKINARCTGRIFAHGVKISYDRGEFRSANCRYLFTVFVVGTAVIRLVTRVAVPKNRISANIPSRQFVQRSDWPPWFTRKR